MNFMRFWFYGLIASFACLGLPARLSAQEFYNIRTEKWIKKNVTFSGRIGFLERGTPTGIYFTPGSKIPHYKRLDYRNITFRANYKDPNTPGLSYTQDVAFYTGDNSYAPRGAALFPGRHFNKDDFTVFNYGMQVEIDFSRTPNGGVSAFAARYGSMQQPTPCCVQQAVVLRYTDKTRDVIDLIQAYGFERHNSDYFAITTKKLIRSITFENLGHNPMIDNVEWRNATKPK